MIVILFRLLILIALALLIYTIIQYFRNPERQLQIAKSSGNFYIIDDPVNSKKNIQFVYKNCSFEGEKYVGTTEEAFEVVNISLFVKESSELRGITRDDLYFLEEQLLLRYPHAKIEWKHPINKLIITSID